MISQSDNMIFFNNIHYDIHFIHGTLKNYNEFPEELLPHNIQLMAIDDISADLIEKMMHNLPFYLSHIEYKSRTIQKRNLKFLLVALEEFGYTPINDSVSKHEDDTINLWNVVDGNTPDNLRTYLNLLRTALRFINLHTPMKPISFKVTTNNTSIVQLQLKSEISCAGFEFINIPNVDYLFWQLIHD
ncbi:MAG TPA: hypothetical protein VLL52_21780, partial [Anaerolineae bacterium]|nr:hypothetical protein [Anaerolineae bacterium]